MKKLKEYCVHIYPNINYEEMENIMAKNEKEAELKAVKMFNGGNYGDIGQVEVMRVCHCSEDEATDNDFTNKRCDNCNKLL